MDWNIKMKYVYPLLLVLMVVILNRVQVHNKDHLSNMAQNAYESGCYHEAENLCSDIEDVGFRGECYEDALKKCPVAAVKFKEWVSKK